MYLDVSKYPVSAQTGGLLALAVGGWQGGGKREVTEISSKGGGKKSE